MTIGIGGWGSRRKPMSIVRAIARSDLKDLTVVSYGGPDVGLLCATGKVKKVVYPFCSLDSIALEPHFRNARQSGAVQTLELDEGMFLLGLQAAAWRVPFLPTRVGLGSFVVDRQPEIKTVRSPYDDGEELVAAPALDLDVAIVHMHRGDARGNGQYLNVDPYMDDLVALAAPKVLHERRAGRRRPTSSRATARCRRMLDQPADDPRCRRGAERRALHRVRARLRPRRGVPEGVRGGREGPRRVGRVEGEVPRLRRSRRVPEGGRAVSDADPRRLLRDRRRRVLPRRRRDHGQPDRHHPRHRRPPRARRVRARPRDDRRRGAARRQRLPLGGDDGRQDDRGVEPVPHDVRRRVVGPSPRDDGRVAARPVRQPELRLHR